MADPEEKSPKASADLGGSKDTPGQLVPIEEEEESTMKGNLPPAVLAIVGRRPRPEKPAAARPPQDSIPDSAPPKLAELAKPDDDESSDSLTATAPRVARPLLPFHIPGSVEIRTVEHDELLDETEVKTVPGSLPESPPSTARPAAGRPPSRPSAEEESITARSPADDEPLTSPGGDAPTMPGREAPTLDRVRDLALGVVPSSEPSAIPKTHDDADDDEESVTRLSPAGKPPALDERLPEGEDDSTEATAPPVKPFRSSGPAPAAEVFDNDSDGTTRKRAAPELGQLDEESFDSITNQDQATQIREMAADLGAVAPAEPVPKLNDEPEEEEHATQVMANGPPAPQQPPAFPLGPFKKPRNPTLHGIAPPADLLPTNRPENAPAIAIVGITSSEAPKGQESESGLKIAPPPALTTERANPAVLGNVVTTAPNLAALLSAPSSGAHAVVPPDGTPLPPPGSLGGGPLSVSAVPTTTRDRAPDATSLPLSAKMGAVGPVLAPDGTPLPISGAHAAFSSGPHASLHRLSVEPPPHSHVPSSLGPPSLGMSQEGDLGGKVPRWGIIVAAVAAACIAFPILLYVVLNRPADPVVVLPAELVPLSVKREGTVRTKHDRRDPKHGSDPSPPPTSSSAKKPDPKRR